MFAQTAGSSMLSDPFEVFEQTIRPIEESAGPLPNLDVDKLLGFQVADTDRIFEALQENYPEGHWAVDRSRFSGAIEEAMQLLSAGLCKLRNYQSIGFESLDCCARIVNSPTLSPYVRKSPYSYIIIPTGFISSLEKFISSTYALAAISSFQLDPNKKTLIWDQDIFLGSIARLASDDVFVFTNGVMEASLESSLQQVLDDFFDPLTFTAFNRDFHQEIAKEMGLSTPWEKFGINHLNEALDQHQEIKRRATALARLSVCLTISHEFGHAFAFAMDGEGAQELAADEALADSLGVLILHRLIEANVIPIITGCEVTHRDMGNALAGFHAWNLSKGLGSLLKKSKTEYVRKDLDNIHQVAVRWEQAVRLIRRVWIDSVPALHHSSDDVTTGLMITNHWGLMIAGMLRIVLLKNGHNADMETACKILPLLVNRESKLYSHLHGGDF